MNIAIYYPGSVFECGGIGNWIFEVSKRLSEKHALTLVGLKQPLSKQQSSQRVSQLMSCNVQYLELFPLKLPVGVALPHPFCFSKLIRAFNNSDLVYVILPCYPTEALLRLLKGGIKSKLIAGFHGQVRTEPGMFSAYLPVFKQTLKTFETFHVLNTQTYNWVQDLGFRNVYCIPNGVDTEQFKLCEHPTKSSIFNILYVGWLTVNKGIHTIIEIARCLHTFYADKRIKIIICGSGPLEPLVAEASEKYGNIEYLGYVPSDQMAGIYEKSHLFLFPSLMEGMPLSLLESQSSGLPAVGSNIPGISEVVCDRVGTLVDVDNLQGFIDAIKSYYELWFYSPRKYFELNKYIRSRTIMLYDWAAIMSKFELILQQGVSCHTITSFSLDLKSANTLPRKPDY